MLGEILAANTDIELAPRFLPHTEQSRGRGSKQWTVGRLALVDSTLKTHSYSIYISATFQARISK